MTIPPSATPRRLRQAPLVAPSTRCTPSCCQPIADLAAAAVSTGCRPPSTPTATGRCCLATPMTFYISLGRQHRGHHPLNLPYTRGGPPHHPLNSLATHRLPAPPVLRHLSSCLCRSKPPSPTTAVDARRYIDCRHRLVPTQLYADTAISLKSRNK